MNDKARRILAARARRSYWPGSYLRPNNSHPDFDEQRSADADDRLYWRTTLRSDREHVRFGDPKPYVAARHDYEAPAFCTMLTCQHPVDAHADGRCSLCHRSVAQHAIQTYPFRC